MAKAYSKTALPAEGDVLKRLEDGTLALFRVSVVQVATIGERRVQGCKMYSAHGRTFTNAADAAECAGLSEKEAAKRRRWPSEI